MITVVLPIGPERHHRAYLQECLESWAAQTVAPTELLVVNDGGGPGALDEVTAAVSAAGLDAATRHSVWSAPWNIGISAAYNCGIALAQNDLCFMMGADDIVDPGLVEALTVAWETDRDPRGYYYVGIRYGDGRPDQDLPCNAAMVHREGWRRLGGFPPESAVGAMDAAVISIILGNPEAGTLRKVADGRPLYTVRIHEHQHTATRQPWSSVILQTRDILTAMWEPHT